MLVRPSAAMRRRGHRARGQQHGDAAPARFPISGTTRIGLADARGMNPDQRAFGARQALA